MAVPSLGRTSAARGFLLLSILSLLLFDAAVNAQAMSPSQTRVPARAQRDHQGAVTAPATTSTTASSSLPVPTYFSAQIIVPPSVVLNESTNVAISQQDAEAGSNLVLCQTSASSGSSPSSADTWFVLAIPADAYGGYNPKVLGTSFPITFLSVDGFSDWTNFFLCWAIGAVDPFTRVTCESYSDYFDVTQDGSSGGNEGGYRLRRRIAYPAPDAPLVQRGVETLSKTLLVTQSTAILALSTSGVAGTVSTPGATTTSSTGSLSATTAPTAVPSKGLSTNAKIGIGVAIPLITIIILVLAGLWYLRRRKDNNKEASLESKYISTAGGSGDTMSSELPSDTSIGAGRPSPSEADGNAIHESDGRGVPNMFELSDAGLDGTGPLKHSHFPPSSGREKLRAFDPSTQAAKMSLNAGGSNHGGA